MTKFGGEGMSRLRGGSRRGSCGAGLTAVPFLAGLGAGAVLESGEGKELKFF